MYKRILLCFALFLSSPKAVEVLHPQTPHLGSFYVQPTADLFKVLEPEMRQSTSAEVREHAVKEVYSKDPQRIDRACLVLIALFVCLSDVQSILDLANYYVSYGNNEMALLWLMSACGVKNPEAMYLTAKMHIQKNHPRPQVSEAIRLLTEASELGHNRARDYLANMYREGILEEGKRVFKDPLKAYQLYGISLDESRDSKGIPRDHCAVAMRAAMLMDGEIYGKSDPLEAYEILMLTPDDSRCQMLLRSVEKSPWVDNFKSNEHMPIVKGYLKGRDLPRRVDRALLFLNKVWDTGQILHDEYSYYQFKISLRAGGIISQASLSEKIGSLSSTHPLYTRYQHLFVRYYLEHGDRTSAETRLKSLTKRKDPWAFAKLAEVYATPRLASGDDLQKAAAYMVQAIRLDTTMLKYKEKIGNQLAPRRQQEFDQLVAVKMSEQPWYSSYFSHFRRS